MLESAALDAVVVERLTQSRTRFQAVRVFDARHRSTPTGIGPGDSRFTTSGAPYKVLYCAEDFETAYLEAVVRDQHERESGPLKLPYQVVSKFCHSRITHRMQARLRLLDLTGTGCVQLGIPTDTVRAKHHADGRALGARINAYHQDAVDGIVFSSRFTEREVYAIFDWASFKLEGHPSDHVAEHSELPGIIKRYNVVLICQ